MRSTMARLVAPILRITGYRFSRTHRVNEDIVYRLVDTVQANARADCQYEAVAAEWLRLTGKPMA